MRIVGLVALHVFRECVRDKVLYSLVAFAVLIISASYLLAQLTAGQDVKIIKDLGLAAISVIGLLIAIFIGIGLVWKEVERRSIYGVLSKPVRRHEFVLGKFAGLVLTLAVNVALMTVALYVLLAYYEWRAPDSLLKAWAVAPTDPALLQAVVLIAVELALVTAVALFFSTFSSPLLSAGLTFGLWVAGHFNADLRNFEAIVESKAAVWVTRALYYVLPNFASFDIKAQAVSGQPIATGDLLFTIVYGVTYIALALCGAVIVLARRDLK